MKSSGGERERGGARSEEERREKVLLGWEYGFERERGMKEWWLRREEGVVYRG